MRRRPGRHDGWQVEMHLLAKGRHCLDRLAVMHLEQWQVLADAVERRRATCRGGGAEAASQAAGFQRTPRRSISSRALSGACSLSVLSK